MSALDAIGSWFRRAYEAIKRFEEALDYRYEDYAQQRFRRLEERLAALEDRPGNGR